MTGKQSEVLRMRVELDSAATREPHWPVGVAVRTFDTSDADALHALLKHAYRGSPEKVAPFNSWLPRMTGDDEFDARLWFLAEAQGALVGAVLCWTSAFVKDLVVHETWRRRGLGEALLRHAFRALAARGAATVELKTDATNFRAIALYERLGMSVASRAIG